MSLDFTDGTLTELFHWLREDVHAPTYYLVLWATLKTLGLSAWAGRVPGVLAGAACVAALFFLVRDLTRDRRAAGLAAVLLAVSPHFIEFSREIHPFSLSALFAVLSWWFFVRILRTGRWVHAAPYALATALLPLTFYPAALIPVAQLLLCPLLRLSRRKWKQLVVAWVAAGLLFCAWIPSLTAQLTQSDLRKQYVIDQYYPHGIGWGDVARAVGDLAFGAAARRMPIGVLAIGVVGLLGLGLLGTLAAAPSKDALRPRRRRLASLALCWAFWIPLLLFLAACLVKPILVSRYLTMLSPFLAAILGAALARATRLGRTGAAASRPWNAALRLLPPAVLLLFLLFGYGLYLREIPRQDWRGVAETLLARMGPQDVIVVDSITSRGCLDYVLRLEGRPLTDRLFTFDQFVEITRGVHPFADRTLWFLDRQGLTPRSFVLLLRRENRESGSAGPFQGGFLLRAFRGRTAAGLDGGG